MCKAPTPTHFCANTQHRTFPGAHLRYVHPLRTAVKVSEVPGDIHFVLGFGLLQQIVNGDEGSTAIQAVTGEPHEILSRTALYDGINDLIQGYPNMSFIMPICACIYVSISFSHFVSSIQLVSPRTPLRRDQMLV